ncbi:MAG: GSCFA domain-containing protein [Candidatus Eremiobacteraeota bacterium]|nr:GSCFA domain-containing protein [Candidatus Eremiobacteraeota bacterium]
MDFEAVDKWFVGEHCNRYPLDRPLGPQDILQGWMPSEKFIQEDTKVLAFGSCFAEYFIKFLTERGYNRWQLPVEKHGLSSESLLFSLGQTFENIFVVVQQLRWAFGEFTPESALWFTKDKNYFEATEERRENIRTSFVEVDVIVVTLGLSEVWFDAVANEPMWRPITSRLYDPKRHVFRSSTVAQTLAALFEFDRLARTFLPDKKFILTLSPIPLLATFRDQSPVTANVASKAILKSAMDEFFSNAEICNRSRYYYFPSYELAFHLFANPFGADNRHVRPEVARTILHLFSELYTDLSLSAAAPQSTDRVFELQQRIVDLQAELILKEQVIRELDIAARERLAIIQGQTSASLLRESNVATEGPGLSNFYSEHYRRHNGARLNHLASLGLPLEKRSVLEVGAGPGHHTAFYVERNCNVVATDARAECTEKIRSTFPAVRTAVVDMNHPWRLAELGLFDIVHCYGLLYHLEDPEAAIREMAARCTSLLLLETCVSATGSEINPVPELHDDYTQSVTGMGCRPGRAWVFEALRKYFPYVYETRTQPNHDEFPLDWTTVEAGQGLTRIVTVSSRDALDNPLLSLELLDKQELFLG